MQKALLTLGALLLLSACQTTGSLRPGEVTGTDIGTIIADEANLVLARDDLNKMNAEIEKALFFSDNGLTTRWYAGVSARIRPTGDVRNRRDRDCRRFRHSLMIRSQWMNGTAVACREHNVPWYLISNRWDNHPQHGRIDDRPRRDRPAKGRGQWDNLSDELRGRPADKSFDDFGPRDW